MGRNRTNGEAGTEVSGVACARSRRRYLRSRLCDLCRRWLLPFSLSPLRLLLLRDELRDELLLERLLLLEHANNKQS